LTPVLYVFFRTKRKGSNIGKEVKGMENSNGETDALEILIRRAQNGFFVEVNYPPTMVPNPQLDSLRSLFSSIAKANEKFDKGEEQDKAAIMKTLVDGIAMVTRPKKSIRSAREEYVFQSMDAMLKFVRETISSVDAAEAPEAVSE
jgi:hypothetical protein